jgi:hypothetical protein
MALVAAASVRIAGEFAAISAIISGVIAIKTFAMRVATAAVRVAFEIVLSFVKAAPV